MSKKNQAPVQQGDFESLVASIVRIHQQAQKVAAKAVNVSLTLRNWFIGHRIVEFEQHGDNRAAYGESLIDRLAQSLATQGLPRVTPRELRRYRQLYQVYPRIWESVTPKSLAQAGFNALLPLSDFLPISIRESVTPESEILEAATPQLIYRLSFTHLSELIQLSDDTQRHFYEIECIRGNWSVRELRRQIASLYYERSGLSKDKSKLSAMAHATAQTLQPAQVIRDPYVFEFLGLRSRDVMGESDLEDALLDRLQALTAASRLCKSASSLVMSISLSTSSSTTACSSATSSLNSRQPPSTTNISASSTPMWPTTRSTK